MRVAATVGVVVVLANLFWGAAVLMQRRSGATTAAAAAPTAARSSPPSEPPSESQSEPHAGVQDAAAHDPSGSPSRLDVVRLLRAKDFARLTGAIEAEQAAVERDIRRERQLARLLGGFDTADPAMLPVIDEWVQAGPASFAPRLARGTHRIALAWASRGTQFANETSRRQFAGMETHLAHAVEDARAVLERNPRVGEAHRILINAAMALGDQEGCAKAASLGLAALPASMAIRSTLASCFLPRWGGSYRLVEALAREADAYVKENPALAALHGYVDWDLGRVARTSSLDRALEHYGRALQAGEHWFYYRDRANAHLRQQHYIEALGDATRGLAIAPEQPDLLTIRVRALSALGRYDEAGAAMRLVAEIDPTNPDLAALRDRERKSAAAQGYQQYTMNDLPGAVARLTRGIELAGGTAEVHYWRGRAYLKMEDRERALADFETAIRLDARHFESYRNVDYILASRREWDRIISYWTEYITVEPTDGRAYMERGGARFQKGDRAAALADARKGCELGTKEACDILPRLAGSR